MTASESVRVYLEHCESRNLSPFTVRNYRENLAAFASHLDASGADLGTLTVFQVAHYLQQRRKVGRSAAALHMEGRTIHAYLNWAAEIGHVPAEVALKMRVPRAPKTEIEPFSEWQVNLLLSAAAKSGQPERNAAILLLLADTGIRAAELCAVRDQDVKGDRVAIHGKGNRARTVPISAATADAIRLYQSVRGTRAPRLFMNRKGNPLNPHALYQLFRLLGERAGITGIRCSPHTMRHAVGVAWVRHGGDVFSLQKLLGHSNLNMTRRYVTLVQSDIALAHQRHGMVRRLR